MTLYAESSAVLAWLLGERAGHRVRELFRRADLFVASDLVLIECDRFLIRAVTLGDIPEAIIGEIDTLTYAHTGMAQQQEDICRQIVAPEQFLLN